MRSTTILITRVAACLAFAACSCGGSSPSGGGPTRGGGGSLSPDGSAGGNAGGAMMPPQGGSSGHGAGGGTSTPDGGGPSTRDGGSSAAIFPDPTFTGESAAIAVGADGVTRLVYMAADPNGSSLPIRYGECASSCNDGGSWKFVVLGEYGSGGLGGSPRLALDAAGHPRVMWFSQADVGGASGFLYAECDTGCTTATNWHANEIIMGDAFTFRLQNSSFTLDPTGARHVLFQGSLGATYASCSTDCTNAASWTLDSLTSLPPNADLRFDAQGRLRAAYENFDPDVLNGYDLYYAECGGDCGQDASWQTTALFNVSTGTAAYPFSLALAPDGSPRLAFYDGNTNQLDYAWCSSTCTQAASWSVAIPSFPPDVGRSGVALAVGSDGAPRIAFSGSSSSGAGNDSASLAVCSSGCTSTAQAWNISLIESSGDIATPPPDPCSTGTSTWQLGNEPTLALDASSRAHVAYDLYALFKCQVATQPDGTPVYVVNTLPGPIRYAQP